MSAQDLKKEIHSIEDLCGYYHHINPEQNLYVGIEWERSGVYRDTLQPVQFLGENGYQAIYRKLIDEVGWDILKEEKGNVYELERGGAKVTTEADGRPELAGSPQENLHDLAREMRLHNNEIVEMGNIFNIGWLPLCWQPFHDDNAIQFVPKDRYRIYGKMGIEDQVKRNNGLTTNLSYTDSHNLIRKTQTLFRITPIVAAISASGPFSNGKLTNVLDMRRKNLKEHPERYGVPTNILDPDFSLEDWINFYIDLPLTFIFINGTETRPSYELTFRQWMEDGYEGSYPSIDDFDQHIKSTWSDLRLRPSYIECRIAGSVPYRLTMSIPALIKGLIFDSESWDAITALTKDWTYQDIMQLDEQVISSGLQTEFHGKTVLTYAQELITIANEKLHGFERTDASEEDESIYLAPLKEQIHIKEKSPAEELVELYEGEWNRDLSRLIKWCEAD